MVARVRNSLGRILLAPASAADMAHPWVRRSRRLVVSLLTALLAALLIAWAFSYDRTDRVLGRRSVDLPLVSVWCEGIGDTTFLVAERREGLHGALGLIIEPGSLTLWRRTAVQVDEPSRFFYRQLGPFRVTRDDSWIPAGSSGERARTYRPVIQRVSMPFWIPAILTGVYPLIALLRGPLRRARRLKRGLCLTCGYDLRGSPEPRCPECGMPDPARAADATKLADHNASSVP